MADPRHRGGGDAEAQAFGEAVVGAHHSEQIDPIGARVFVIMVSAPSATTCFTPVIASIQVSTSTWKKTRSRSTEAVQAAAEAAGRCSLSIVDYTTGPVPLPVHQ